VVSEREREIERERESVCVMNQKEEQIKGRDVGGKGEERKGEMEDERGGENPVCDKSENESPEAASRRLSTHLDECTCNLWLASAFQAICGSSTFARGRGKGAGPTR
jgi:hypothetical protein